MSATSDNIYIAAVDDDESIRRSLVRLLRALGMQPVTYASAEAFLSDDKRPRFDCLLLDVHLGGMSGIELKKQLDRNGSTLPVIFITAHDDPASEAAIAALNCEGFFRKTAQGEEIHAAIQRAVVRSRTLPGQAAANKPDSSFLSTGLRTE